MTIDLEEPLYPVADSKFVIDNGGSLLDKFDPAPKFPSSLDAVKDFDDAVLFLVS